MGKSLGMAAKGVASGQNFLINCINDLYQRERAGQRGQQGVVVLYSRRLASSYMLSSFLLKSHRLVGPGQTGQDATYIEQQQMC